MNGHGELMLCKWGDVDVYFGRRSIQREGDKINRPEDAGCIQNIVWGTNPRVPLGLDSVSPTTLFDFTDSRGVREFVPRTMFSIQEGCGESFPAEYSE